MTISPQEAPADGIVLEPRDHVGSQDMSVLIVDDHRLFADALRLLLEVNGVRVVGIATKAPDALALLRATRPGLVLVDLELADADGVQLGLRILSERPATKMVGLSGTDSPNMIREVIQAGFHAYLTKDVPGVQLINSIRAALAGQVTIPHRLASAAAGARSPIQRETDLIIGHLTRREAEVLALLVEGAHTQEIAAHLSLSANTVRTHIQSILGKLGVHSRLEAATFAVRHGLVKLQGEKRYA